MLQKMQEFTGIIRERGQLTIPKKVRRDLPWVHTDASVRISVKNNMLYISEPQQKPQTFNQSYWKKLREKISLARSFTYAGSVTQNIRSDRDGDRQ